MKLCMFTPKEMALERGWPGRVEGDRIVQLAAQTLQAFFTGGGGAREHAEYALDDCDLLAPVLYPPAVRVFRPFEHGRLFTFRSPFPVLGPEAALAYPSGTSELDFGLALAAVVGAEGEIGGFTLANDWSARDLARIEREAGLGPSKSSDFGLSLGPLMVTLDEVGTPRLTARVNGEERVTAELSELMPSWPGLIAEAGRNTALRPGDVLVARVPQDEGAPLQPEDVVELEAAGIGVLRNRVSSS
ncbi:MAG TPA: fumarylacetoacetate hydrolase family protein [Gaiellaceae bacterium]|nr:fumarylacetoacetate hydrolase family protein [Gaiellaceae bacterium]